MCKFQKNNLSSEKLFDQHNLLNQFTENLDEMNITILNTINVLIIDTIASSKTKMIDYIAESEYPNNITEHEAYYNLIKHGCFIVSSSVVFNKKCAESIGFFDSKSFFISSMALI